MKYIKDDLDYIFIRAKNPAGRWDSLSLNQVTDKQFVSWAEERFGIQIEDDSTAKGTPWEPQQKVDFLNNMNKRMGGKPCVCMIKRGARKKWNKKPKKSP